MSDPAGVLCPSMLARNSLLRIHELEAATEVDVWGRYQVVPHSCLDVGDPG